MRARLIGLCVMLVAPALGGCFAGEDAVPLPQATTATGDAQEAGARDPPATFGQISWHPREPRPDQTLRVRMWVDGGVGAPPRCLPVVGEPPGGGGGVMATSPTALEPGRFFECEIVPVKPTPFFAFSVLARDRTGAWFLSDFFVVPTVDAAGAARPASGIAAFDVTAAPGDAVRASVTVEPAFLANPAGTTTGVAHFVRLPFEFNGVVRHGARLTFDEVGRLAGEAAWVEPDAPEWSGMHEEHGVLIGVATTRNAFGGTAVSERVIVPFGSCVGETCLRV